MKILQKIMIALLLLIGAPACRTSDGGSSVSVVGGRAVTAKDPIAKHVVALVSVSSTPQSFCSGVIVARDMVLTAAHCFTDKPRKIGFAFGNTLPASGTDPNIQIISAYKIHPGFSGKAINAYLKAFDSFDKASASIPHPAVALNDLALIRIPGELPDGYEPIAIETSLKTLRAATWQTAGFGCTSTECSSEPTKLRKVSVSLNDIATDTNTVIFKAKTGSGACSGDSGGPDFFVNEDGDDVKLGGIVSVGPTTCEYGVAVDTLVYPYKSWITQTAEDLRSGGS